MLIESGAPLHFLGEAILIACHVLNRVPHKKSHTTPLGYLRVWGCLANVGLLTLKYLNLV